VPPGITFRQAIALFFGLVLFMALPPLAVVVTTSLLSRGEGMYRAEIVLPAVLLVGVVTLIAVLTMLVLVFSRLNLTSPTGALGLPDGTIQAVIALALILIFAIIGVYLHGVSGNGEQRTLTSLSRAQLDALPAGEIVSQRGIGGGRWTAVIEPLNEEQDDIAKQLLTTISTLVVAVAGFYFGAKSVREAALAVRPAPGAGATAAGEGEPEGPDEGEDVDEATAYGEQSPVTGLGHADVEDEVAGAPAEDEGDGETAEAETAAPSEEPAFEEHPDYQPEPDFYPDEEDQAADEDSPPEPAEGDDEDDERA